VSKRSIVLKLAGLVRDPREGRQTHDSAEPQGLAPLAVRIRTPAPAEATTGYRLLDRIAPLSHYAFYVLVLLMVASGYTTGILAGLPAIVFGGSRAPLPPTFMIYPSWVAHGYLATLLVGFIILHVVAACYHQFVRKDALFRRMSFGRRLSVSSTPYAGDPTAPSPTLIDPARPRSPR
jgi:hypothetical protein